MPNLQLLDWLSRIYQYLTKFISVGHTDAGRHTQEAVNFKIGTVSSFSNYSVYLSSYRE